MPLLPAGDKSQTQDSRASWDSPFLSHLALPMFTRPARQFCPSPGFSHRNECHHFSFCCLPLQISYWDNWLSGRMSDSPVVSQTTL